MGRIKGSTNKTARKVPHTVDFTTEQKLEFIASLIVDRIVEDENNGYAIIKRLKGKDATDKLAKT